MVSSFRAFAIMMTAFYASNDPILHEVESEEYDTTSQRTLAVGRPAELLDNRSIETDVVEDVGHPSDVFLHSADIAQHLDCSLETARNVLQEFEQAGLIKEYGGMDVDVDLDVNVDDTTRHVDLYLPTFDNPKNVMRELYQMEEEAPPNFIIATEEVTPGHFVQIEPSQLDDEKIEELEIRNGSVADNTDGLGFGFDLEPKPIDRQSLFQYTEDESLIIDVSEPEDGTIQDYVSDQLLERDLAASSLKNFVYELRQEAGLV
jgi:hypothetical protein